MTSGWLRHVLLSVILLPQAAAPASAGSSRDQPLHVLLLYSYERDFAPHGQMAASFERELNRQSTRAINYFDISLQPARASKNPDDEPTLQYLLSTFAGQRLDLIVSFGGPAAQFAVRHRERLFPSTPLLLAAVDRQPLGAASLPANTAAVAVANDGPLIIETALSLLPNTNAVYVVIGTSALEDFWRNELGRQFQRFRDKVAFRWLNGLSATQLLERAAELPPNSIIFYSIFSIDAKGAPQVEERVLHDLHAAANAPIFGFHSGQLGNGIVGGPLMSLQDLVQTTTNVALLMLERGAADGALQTQGPGAPSFDWRELRRWNIPENRLPAGSVVLFRQPTTWQQYRGPIIVGTSVALLETGLVVALLTIQVKRRRAERALRESEERFRLLADGAPVMVWMSGVDKLCTDFNRPWLAFTGRTIEQERGNGWTDGVHVDDLSACLDTYHRAFDRRESFRIEYRLRRHDGEYRWILDTGLPRHDEHGAFLGYIGSCVDVTELKLAKASLSSLSRKLMQTHEDARTWIARELHEDLGQRLAGLTMQLHSLTHASVDDNLRARVGDLCAQFGDLGRDIQAVSYRLYSYRLEYLGVAAAIRAICRDVTLRHPIRIEFVDSEAPETVPRDVGLGLFRVIHEALDNAVRHARARVVVVELSGRGPWARLGMAIQEIQLQVSDDGIGFDPEAVKTGGLGLIHMRERLSLVGGEFAVNSQVGAGTTVTARIAFVPHTPADPQLSLEPM
jgi:PAS domain S-box-containing protein